MSLILQTSLLAVCTAFFSALPVLYRRTRPASPILFFVGTGALFGVCIFDLIPDIYELGGAPALWVMACAGVVYSAGHRFWPEHEAFSFFFASLLAHGFASGMLLSISRDWSTRISSSVFFALFLHKIYESLLLGSILRAHSNFRRNWVRIVLFSAALPVGVGVAYGLEARVSRAAGIWIGSAAVGTLLGCLCLDFLLPSLQRLRSTRWLRVVWIFAGLFLTRIVMFWTSRLDVSDY